MPKYRMNAKFNVMPEPNGRAAMEIEIDEIDDFPDEESALYELGVKIFKKSEYLDKLGRAYSISDRNVHLVEE